MLYLQKHVLFIFLCLSVIVFLPYIRYNLEYTYLYTAFNLQKRINLRRYEHEIKRENK